MCDQVDTIFRAIAFIETHLESEITVAQIAESVGYSLFHFIRTFNRVVHHAPYDYLTRRRLSEAARILITGDRRITDISQDFCFNNQETFSRAFKRMFGVQPSYWRERGRMKKLENIAPVMPPKSLADLRFCNGAGFQYPVIENLNETALYGLMTPLDVDCQVQQRQRSSVFLDLCELFAGSTPERFVAVTSYIDQNWEKAYYFIGAEINEPFSVCPALAAQTLPAGRYVKIFAAEGERQLALNYLYFTWFPKTGLKPVRQMEIEIINSLDKNTRLYGAIYIPVDFARDGCITLESVLG